MDLKYEAVLVNISHTARFELVQYGVLSVYTWVEFIIYSKFG